jgi:hypothetical protein
MEFEVVVVQVNEDETLIEASPSPLFVIENDRDRVEPK